MTSKGELLLHWLLPPNPREAHQARRSLRSGCTGGDGLNRIGTDDNTRTLPTDSRINKGSGRTSGCRSSGVRQREQIGVAPLGG